MNLLKIISPKNLSLEREKFFASKVYNPVFAYSWQDELPEIKDTGVKSQLVKSIIKQDLSGIIEHSKKFFEIPRFDELDAAELATRNTPDSLRSIEIVDFINSFKKAFRYLGLDGYEVKVVDQEGFNFRPSPKNKKIYMSKHANFQFFDDIGEVRHELVHIVRYENGVYNRIKKSINYLPTEEGLATLMQDTGPNGNKSEFQHAAEYIGSKIGLEGSLRDIYNYFREVGFGTELAWQRASRHKFGFIDTAEPGDILKPAMYFANSQKISKLTSSQKLKLFIGKIALNDLSKYPEYNGLVELEKLKKFYNLD